MKTSILTIMALIAFAANSIICRMALATAEADPAIFSTIRIASGALILWLLAYHYDKRMIRKECSIVSAALLCAYALCFSYAYITLPAGTGALILFGSVQITMIVVGLLKGERYRWPAWLGVIVAIAGLVYLVSPGVSAPLPLGALLMTLAGVAWGGYTLRGRNAANPLTATAANFIYALPLIIIIDLPILHGTFFTSVTTTGIVLGVVSGAIASAMGYIIWYAALSRLSPIRAASAQLAVPIIAAYGGVVILDELFTSRLIIAAVLTLLGISLVVMTTRQSVARTQ